MHCLELAAKLGPSRRVSDVFALMLAPCRSKSWEKIQTDSHVAIDRQPLN